MKDQILKIAKVKSEKEFYKKYPTEEAFMKAHGKAFKKAAMGKAMVAQQLDQLTDFGNEPKAQVGAMIGATNTGQNTQPIFRFQDALTNVEAMNAGISKEEMLRQKALEKEPAPSSAGGGIGDLIGAGIGIAGELLNQDKDGDIVKDLPIHEYGGELRKAQFGLSDLAAGIKGIGAKSGGLGNLIGDTFGGDKGTKGIMGAVGGNDKGLLGMTGGLKSLGNKAGLGAAGKAAGLGLLNSAGDIIGGFGQMQEQKNAIKKAEQQSQVTGVTAQAAESKQVGVQKHNFVRPEDAGMQQGALNNPQGSGSNFLQMQDGGAIGGNPTEIQNTYNSPVNLYSDLGFEPLSDSDVKQFRRGGSLPEAEFGDYFQSSGQASVGKGVGSAIGTVFGGPLGSMVGGALGTVVGNLFGGARDAERLREFQEKTKKNTERAAMAQGADAIHSQYSNVMEDGGYMNPNYNPQVIAKFGELTAQDFAKASKEMRSGGHLRDNHFYESDQYAMGGDLKVHRGKAETMSYNPYLPEGGETVMFRGPSHDNGGMPISYGENGVEVEGGEPAVKLQDGGSPDGNLVVFGNMKIPDYGVKEIGDNKAKGKKFKNYIADLSKVEAKQNKIIEKAIGQANDSDDSDPYSQLSLNASRASLLGANMKLKQIADKKQAAAMVQNAILDTAEEFGVESDGLAKGEIKPIKDPLIGKNGKKLKKAQAGFYDPITHQYVTDMGYGNQDMDMTGLNAADLEMIKRGLSKPGFMGAGATDLPVFVATSSKKAKKKLVAPAAPQTIDPNLKSNIEMKKKNKDRKDYTNLAMALLSGLNNMRPSNQMGLDPDQLMGEYYALGQNQLDPVQAQKFQPLLEQPFDISLQDQLNEITAQARAAERMAGSNNPAAAAMIFAQAAEAKNKVLAEQFRMNQANKAQTYNKNREVLNQAQLQNLNILDQQYVRQAEAKSKTKAQAIEALKSIGDKIAQNKAENLKMGVLENMYGFRFDNRGRAVNYNPLTFFNEMGNPNSSIGSGGYGPMNIGGQTFLPIDYDDKTGEPTKFKLMKKDGGKVKAKNGSIVKAIKNL